MEFYIIAQNIYDDLWCLKYLKYKLKIVNNLQMYAFNEPGGDQKHN